MIKQSRVVLVVLLLLSLFLVSCGSSEEEGDGGKTAAIILSAGTATIPADGSSSTAITAVLADGTGGPVTAGTAVTFTTDIGRFANGGLSYTVKTPDDSGTVTVTLIAGTTPGTAHVVAESRGITQAIEIAISGVDVASVTVTAGSASVEANGTASTLISALVLDTGGARVADGLAVVFSTTAGTLSDITATENGTATAKLTSSTNLGTATVTAEVLGISGSTTVAFVAGPPATLSVSASPSTVKADGVSTSEIRAEVFDAQGNPVADGETLTFDADYGRFSKITEQTADGVATVTYIAPASKPVGGSDTITVESTNEKTGTVTIKLEGPSIATIALSAAPQTIPADGTSTSTVSATVTLEGGGPATEKTVTFTIIDGGGSFGGNISTTGTTDSDGVAQVPLTSDTTPGTATIEAAVEGKKAQVAVEFAPGSITLSIIPNSILGTGVETAAVTATLKDTAGNALAGETVTFSVDDVSLGRIINPAPPTAVTDAQGQARAIFEGAEKGGTATITAAWGTVKGSDTVSIQPPPASISVAEGYPDPSSIGVTASGGTTRSEITFDVEDNEGVLVVDGYRIDFYLETGPGGGEYIAPLSARTENGQVTVILNSGFKSGPVSIRVQYYHDATVNITMGQVAISAGPPVGEEFSLSAAYLNISGLTKSLLEDTIAASAADVYGNAVPNGTAVSFKTYNTGGFFDPGSAQTAGGIAVSTLFSADNPKPVQGFVSLTAEAVGGRSTRVTAIEVAPSDRDVVYAGTNGGGVYKSIDGGATWENISRSFENPRFGQNWIDPYVKGHSAIAVDPDDNDYVYVGTGFLGEGRLYRSRDAGMNWNSNNPEEWDGLFAVTGAILTVLCDGDDTPANYPYVWIGTENEGVWFATNGVNFVRASSGLGTKSIVREIVRVPGTHGATAVLYAATNDGVYRSDDGGVNWLPTASFTGDNINALFIHPDSNGTVDILYAGTESSGVWMTVDGGAIWEKFTDAGLGGGLSASQPIADRDNAGNGIIADVTVGPETLSEYWTVTCTAAAVDGGTFSVTGTESGTQAASATVGVPYASDNGEVSFTILDGAYDFEVGDTFDFTTTRDTGKRVLDLLVDNANDLLYAVTCFWGTEPHAVGNLYVIDLNPAGGNRPAGDWREANDGLPQYDPPDDTKLCAQYAIAADDPAAPAALFVGGEGINLYKAEDGLDAGSPEWNISKQGLSNLIMARMPVLFSGDCNMFITEDGSAAPVYTYTIYVEDLYGNPPVEGSKLEYTTYRETAFGEYDVIDTVTKAEYGDCLTHEGTWRDPNDPVTNDPYIIDVDFTGIDAVKFTFTPTNLDVAPGSSGGVEESGLIIH